jgi:hypothetical protein
MKYSHGVVLIVWRHVFLARYARWRSALDS